MITHDTTVSQWLLDDDFFPVVEYTGPLPFPMALERADTSQTEDPYFLLGNYRLLLLPHVSGKYQLITGERSWGRLNQGKQDNSGANHLFVEWDGQKIDLTDIYQDTVQVQRNFRCGVGYVIWEYAFSGIVITKKITIRPSLSVTGGQSIMQVDIEIKNDNPQAHQFLLTDVIIADYEMNYQQNWPKKVDYKARQKDNNSDFCAVEFETNPREPFLWKDKNSIAEYEGFPPVLFMGSKDKASIEHNVDAAGNSLQAIHEVNLKGGGVQSFSYQLGFSFEEDYKAEWKAFCEEKTPVADQWQQVLPTFETDNERRSELLWHAHTLEALSQYSRYFQETKTPQGSQYDFLWGLHASVRDHLQHLLPMCYYNPTVAKSALRYALKKENARGQVPIMEKGFGYQTDDVYIQSDNQLFLLHAINEYLRITGDSEFLYEVLPYYPLESKAEGTVLDHIEKMVLFLRDEIGLGPRGLVRLLNSDWNDDLHFVLANEPFNRMYEKSESHLNTTMAIVMYQQFVQNLSSLKPADEYTYQIDMLKSIAQTQATVLYENIRKDLGGASFFKRFYWVDQPIGNEEVYMWPQAFGLQIPYLDVERKAKMIEVVNERLVFPEKAGGRLMEGPLPFVKEHYCKDGCGENGAFWFAPYAQYVIGVAQVDLNLAWELFDRMSLQHIGQAFPDFWLGQWTASDYINSSISETQGHAYNMPYNAHAHAYPLYTYYRLKELEK
ncbi:GH36-type glycosyl hydrolase domain-containing protein [Persicobacter psychrovividus]|uniref:Glycosyl hydrolase 94 catalytic domain-containing protein n=1 Tax=Persicobacter psychrovividus TaxID=387638 RepID=A0ABN6LDG3_9BACT|nr:hypothetical protein PEPS_35200 [Persicobacter psychrovividus]